MWSVELEPEVEALFDKLTVGEFATVLPHVERLAARGNELRMPASQSRNDGLFELRFDLVRVTWRVTYYFAEDRVADRVPQAAPERTHGSAAWMPSKAALYQGAPHR